MTWYLIALATAAALLLIFTILAIMYVYHRDKPHKHRINTIITTNPHPDSQSVPLGDLGYRQVNPQASLGEGIKRAEQRKSYLRRGE